MNTKKYILVFLMVFTLCLGMYVETYAYHIQYAGGSAYRVVGIKNNLSTSYSSQFNSAVSNWNSGLTDRSVSSSSGSASSIIDLNFEDWEDISIDLYFLHQYRYEAYGLYHIWSSNTTTCCANHQATSFQIYINTYMLPTTASTAKKLWVITHEIGHALGLDDFESYSYRDHVMNYKYTYSSYNTPASSEYSAVDTIWDH